jgi:hypothetical protein
MRVRRDRRLFQKISTVASYQWWLRTTIAALETRNAQFPGLGRMYLVRQWDPRILPTNYGAVAMLLSYSAQPLSPDQRDDRCNTRPSLLASDVDPVLRS